MEQTVNQNVLEELKKLRTDVDMLKGKIVDPDTRLTAEEEKIHEEGLKEFHEGKTTSLEDFKRELEEENV